MSADQIEEFPETTDPAQLAENITHLLALPPTEGKMEYIELTAAEWQVVIAALRSTESASTHDVSGGTDA